MNKDEIHLIIFRGDFNIVVLEILFSWSSRRALGPT